MGIGTLKRLFFSLAALAGLTLGAAPAMAQVNGGGPSPYEPGQTQLNVNIAVRPIAEISWEGSTNLDLEIHNFATNEGQQRQKTLRFLGNVDADIFCQVDPRQLPQWTMLTIRPVSARYGTPGTSFTWRKDANVVTSEMGWVKMASMSANSIGQSLGNAGNLVVEFHAQAPHGVAAVANTPVQVKWTVAAKNSYPNH